MKARKPFDTLQFANRMKAVGMEPKLAEEQAEAIADALWNGLDSKLDTLVTKEEFKSECDSMRKDIKSVEDKLMIRCDAIESKLTWLISFFGSATIFISVITFLRSFHII